MAHTFTSLLTHVIFSTKDRRPWMNPELQTRLHPYLGGIVREMRGHALKVNGTADHVHLLVQLPADVSVAEALRVLKTNSSRWVHETCDSRGGFAWQRGYGAFSVSLSSAPKVVKYIANQEEHHSRMSFQEELIAFLKKHHIEYDERFIWE